MPLGATSTAAYATGSVAGPSAGPDPQAAAARPRRAFTMSIDTGGTFTDGFVSDGERTAQVKVDTTPQDLTIGFQACLEAGAAAVGHDLTGFLDALSRLHFSSTIATNTVVERRGATLGLIVTRGAERGLYAADAQAGALGALLDLDLVRGVSEEVDAGGTVITPPSESELETAVRELLERGVRLLVVSFAGAHLNPANELRARELIDRSYPRHYLGAVPLMVASRVSLAVRRSRPDGGGGGQRLPAPGPRASALPGRGSRPGARVDPAAADREHRRIDQPSGQDTGDRHL